MVYSNTGTVRKVSSFSPEANEYYSMLVDTQEFKLNTWTIWAFKFLALLPSSNLYIFQDAVGKVVGGMLFSHLSITVLQWRNIKSLTRLSTFLNLHRKGYKYGSFLVVAKEYRGMGYANLMWKIREKYYLYLLNTSREEKILENGGLEVLQKNGKKLRVLGDSKSIYYKINNR